MGPYSIPYPTRHPAAAEMTSPVLARAKSDRPDDCAGSHSGSDDGSSYMLYHDPQKNDTDPEEDPNASLTSQTLNADGTPKRPMNAFMIFARRRRPQVSAENQSMRTGEISKILSREWNTMDVVDKQFYLDQAKHLKENFNNRYPDYVYRRRPNNSRRRRRPDCGANRPLENPLPNETTGDISGSDTLGEPSPVEGEDGLVDNGVDIHYPRVVHDNPAAFNEHGSFVSAQSRPSTYPYPGTDLPYRPIEPHENRVPYLSAHEHTPQEAPSTLSNGSIRLTDNHYSSYMPSQGHSRPPPQYSPEHSARPGNWEHKGENGRPVPSGWISNHDRPLPPTAASKTLQFSPSSPSQHSPWQTASAPATANSSSPATPQNPSYPFPTLNSPFYPSQPQVQGNYSSTRSSSTSHSASSTHYNSPNLSIQSGPSADRHTSQYDPHSYTPSLPISLSNGYPGPSTTRDIHLYQPSQVRSAVSRPLPPLQLSTFAQSQSHPVHVAPPSSSVGFWARDS